MPVVWYSLINPISSAANNIHQGTKNKNRRCPRQYSRRPSQPHRQSLPLCKHVYEHLERRICFYFPSCIFQQAFSAFREARRKKSKKKGGKDNDRHACDVLHDLWNERLPMPRGVAMDSEVKCAMCVSKSRISSNIICNESRHNRHRSFRTGQDVRLRRALRGRHLNVNMRTER